MLLARVDVYDNIMFSAALNSTGVDINTLHLGPLLLTWVNFNPSMDK